MKAKTALKVGSVGLAALACGLTYAKDITIYDQNSSGSGWYGPQEDNETEPGTVANQNWDLESFQLSGNKLKATGGFDFKNGFGNQAIGDIFIDVNGDAVWGAAAAGTGSGHTVVPNSTFKYDYVVRFNGRGDSAIGLTYDVYALTGASDVTVFYAINQMSNPWILSGNPTATPIIDDATTAFGSYTTGSETHYTMEVDLSWLAGLQGGQVADGDLFHLTMECGNDNLMGRQVPDGGTTLMLLGMGLGGLAFASRRNRK